MKMLSDAIESEVYDPQLHGQLSVVQGRLKEYQRSDHNYLLTDDCAPVEVLGMNLIDGMISEEISYYRDLYKREGITAVISELVPKAE